MDAKKTDTARLRLVQRLDVTGRVLLLPRMTPFGTRFLAASFRAFGVPAVVMETYKGLSLGKEYTSGKECFPCQVTLGDILYFLQGEKERLGSRFDPRRYVYFLPESDGPCRFGMYNKLQRLVLDTFPEYRDIAITYLSTQDAYSVAGLLPAHKARYFRRVAYVAAVIADVFDRIVWRVRPYERTAGMTDAFMEEAAWDMEALLERVGEARDFQALLDRVEEVARRAAGFVDPGIARKPRIGIVGEIYLRTHPESNQDIVRQIERHGGEVVDASIAEWINFVSHERLRKMKRQAALAFRRKDGRSLKEAVRAAGLQKVEIAYQAWRLKQVYDRVLRHLDIQPDHSIREIEKFLDGGRHFSFEIGTEAALSIGGALAHVHEGFHGIVNVFPFTCMPSTICSAILKPILAQKRVPYLDAPYDGTVQPNREVALRTFVYQARQYRDRQQNGNREV
ncbi:Predicted nucleotide-binding protein, sugar kinase/HSP70/actin superfamily [Desulfacinum hydrothermale DSM 13146]|uniref:Predicted nucleotide-binding protein, sugar kinase/HSP70/actin superfamily n=1 Tax=Desulfacinum hydrothermale DSM 13146 TaxID=1121390 RepID=A0A1W1WZB8_9BACT|nr:CoA activase [Desulfacinum hydrothermale]SMC16984.1 Predicted nucleotide-binding protein, sugar kinase/HSP70/actin superfamily [Desulfacinum hydrothermale DSM 13146]